MKNKILKEIVKNTTSLIKYKTIKENYKEIDKALEYIKKELHNYSTKEIIINNYKNLIISNTEEKHLDIIFCAHVDVVPADKYEAAIVEDKIYGRGSIDMKSQLAVIISLLKNNQTNKNIAFLITSDEEIGGACCKEIMKEYSANLAVIPDASKDFHLVVEEKGLLQVEITTTGISAHASEPYKGENAILKLIDIYNELLTIYPMPKHEEFQTTINLSKITGGTATNMVPASATMTLDIRFTKETGVSQIISNIKKTSSEIKVKILDQGPVFQVDETLPVMQEFIKKASTVLKSPLVIEKCVATSDAIYFSEKNIPTILMNPKGAHWHGPNEYVQIDSLYTLYEIFKTLL